MPARSNNKFVNLYINKKWKNKHSKRQRDDILTRNNKNEYYTMIKDAYIDHEITDECTEYYDHFNLATCIVCGYCNVEQSSFCTVCNHSFYNNDIPQQYDLYFNGNDLLSMLYCNRPKNLQFVTETKLNEILKSKSITIIPSGLTPHLFPECMNQITINKFLNHFNRNIKKNKQKYPILKRLYSKINNDTVWNINKVSNTVHWIQFMYNKYNNKLSEHTFNALNIDKVFDNIESYKWGDMVEYKLQYNSFKDSINILSNNNIKNTACVQHDGINMIKDAINVNNSFIMTTKTENVHFFKLTQKHLVNINKSFFLETIKKHSKLFLCFKSAKNRNKLLIVPYITFNIDKIETEIANKCVVGRNKLNITFPKFKFIDNIINSSSNIIQRDMDYDLWSSFDKQFTDNLQRRYALNIIQTVIKLNNKIEKEKEISNFIDENIEYFNNDCKNYQIFKNMKLKHTKYLQNELINRMECNVLNNDKQCYICLDLINISGQTPVQLECCNLLLHYECYKDLIKSKLDMMQSGDRITLSQLGCIMCKNQIKHKLTNNILERLNTKYIEIKQLALNEMRLINGHTYDNMLSYLFYECNKCNKSYFGGLNDCIEDFKQEEVDEKEEKYEKERICLQCMPMKDIENYNQNCSVHGTEYIQWKCCFCCSLATFSCGNTHFCEICHKPPGPSTLWNMQNNKKDELIQCPCLSNRKTHLPEKITNTIRCPLGIDHPPHGEEYCLGCAMCDKNDRIKRK